MALLRELTEKEVSLIPSYRQLWYETALSTTRLNHQQVQEVIQRLYTLLDLEIPNIYFCDNLYALIEKSRSFFLQPNFCEDGLVFPTQIMARIHELQMSFFESIGRWDMALTSQLSVLDGQGIEYKISNHLQQTLLNNLPVYFQGYEMYTHWVFPRIWYADEASSLDFHFSAIQRTLFKEHDDLAWQIYRELIQVSSWFAACDSDCFVCERPSAFQFQSDGISLSSIVFTDGEHLTFLG